MTICDSLVSTVLIIAALTACNGESIVPPPVPAPAITAFTLDSTRQPLVHMASVDLASAAAVEVAYHAATGPTLVVTDDSAALHQQLLLTRLRPATTYTYDIRSKSSSGSFSTASSGTFTTGPLPAGLAEDVFSATGTPTMPLTLLQISSATNGWFGVVALDGEGVPVWYHRTTTGAMGFMRRPNGNIAIIDKGIVVIGARGDTVAALPPGPGTSYGTIHHGIANSTSGAILFTATDTRVISDTSVVGDAVWEWSPEAGTLIKRWSSFDFFNWKTERTYASAPADWLHANAVSVGAHGNTIVSFRNLDQVISISPDWKSLEWRLGGPGSTLAVSADASFQGQHGARELAGGHVLMFDNGFNRPSGETYSRALEFSIDTTAHVARKVWEYRAQPDVFSTRLGSVERYANGNTLIDFGWLSPNPIQIVEVTSTGQTTFRLAPANTIISKIYGALPVSTLFGEVVK